MDSLLKILIDDFGQPAIYFVIVAITIWFTLEGSRRFHNSRKNFATKEDLLLIKKQIVTIKQENDKWIKDMQDKEFQKEWLEKYIDLKFGGLINEHDQRRA